MTATATAQSTDPVWKTALVQDFGSANLVVSTKFMEAYELVRSVSGGADLTTFLNKEGNLDVYSVGTGNQVSRIRQQDDSADGWVEHALGITARQLSAYIPTGGDSNNPNILGLDNENRLTLSTWDQALGHYTQRVFQPSGATKKIKQLLATKNFDNVYVNVILEDDVVGTNFIKPDGTWAARDWVPIKQSQGSTQDAKASFIAMCSNNPVQTALYAIALDGEILFAESSSRFSYFNKIGYIKGSDLAVVQDSMNRLNILALDTSRHLWWKRQKKYQSGQALEWDDWKQVDGTTELVSIDAVLNAAGMVEVFGIGADDDLLFHTRQVGTPDVPVWGTVFPLGNPVPNSIMTVGRSAAGYSEVYTVTHDNRLYRFWQDPMTTQWSNAEIGLQQSAEMMPVPAHSVEILVLDYEGLGQPEADVRIKASNLTSLNINGKYYVASQYRTVTVKSNTSGIVNLFLGTQSLAAPTLFVSTNFTSEAEGVEIQPNAQLQKQLYGVTADQVMNATTVSGEYLLKGEYRTPENAATLAQVSNKAMSLGGPPPVPSSLRARPVGTRRRAQLLREGGSSRRPGPGWRIDHSQVEEQHWSVDFRGGFPRYRDLAREEAAQRLAFIDSAKATSSGAAGFLGVDWGDVWNSIKQGVSRILGTLQEFFVSTIVDPITGLVKQIRVAFEFFIDGVTQFFDTVIEFFQQAFDIVEGIWNKIEVFFRELWEWLAFLFNWGDMKRTAAAIEHTMTQSLEYMILGVRSVRGLVDAGFDSMTDKIKQAVDDYLATIDGQTDLQQYTAENDEPQPALDSSVGHNVLQNAFEANYSDTVYQESKALAGVNAGVDRIVEEIEALVDNFQFGDGKAVFDEAVGYFNQIGSDPDNALKLVMAGTIKMMEGVALFTIAAAKGTVLTILDLVIDVIEAVKTMLTEEWEIPFVSQLYQLITGESLTFRPAQIFSLILAVPSTILYKIMTGDAPFPDDAALTRFTSQYTAQWLAEQSGITPAPKRMLTARQAADMEEWRKWVSGIFGCLYATVFVIKIWLDSTIAAVRLVIDTIGPSILNGKRVRILGIVGIASNLLPILFTTPWIVVPDAGGFGCDGKGLNNLRWLLNACLGAGVGAIFVLAGVPGVVGDLWATLWGACNLGMAIWVAVEGGTDALTTTWAIFTTLAPQLFRFLQPFRVWGGLVIYTVPGLMLTYVLTYPVIAGLRLAITFRAILDEANARLLGRKPAEDTLDEPIAAWQPVLVGGTALQPGLA